MPEPSSTSPPSDLPFLNNSDPLDLPEIPLQVALLTMELRRLRHEMDSVMRSLTTPNQPASSST